MILVIHTWISVWIFLTSRDQRNIVQLCISALVHLYSSSLPSTPPQPPLDSDGLSRGTKNNVTRSPHGNFFSVSRTFINLVTCEGYEGYHRHYVREPSCTKKESSAHLWLPVAIMLDACPTSHKLAEQEVK